MEKIYVLHLYIQFLFNWKLPQNPVIDCNLIIYIPYLNSKNNFILQSNQWVAQSIYSANLRTYNYLISTLIWYESLGFHSLSSDSQLGAILTHLASCRGQLAMSRNIGDIFSYHHLGRGATVCMLKPEVMSNFLWIINGSG